MSWCISIHWVSFITSIHLPVQFLWLRWETYQVSFSWWHRYQCLSVVIRKWHALLIFGLRMSNNVRISVTLDFEK